MAAHGLLLGIALHLLVLHRSDGGEVTINVDQVTSLRVAAGRLHHGLPPGRCLVYLVDGTFVAVLEACTEVRRQLDLLVPP